jgi:hypothetical protein
LVEETGVPGEYYRPDKLYHVMLYTSPWSRFELTRLVAIGTDCIGSCKSNSIQFKFPADVTYTTAHFRTSKIPPPPPLNPPLVYLIQHYGIKFLSDMQQVWFSLGRPLSSTNKTDCHDIAEILLKVSLNTISITLA